MRLLSSKPKTGMFHVFHADAVLQILRRGQNMEFRHIEFRGKNNFKNKFNKTAIDFIFFHTLSLFI